MKYYSESGLELRYGTPSSAGIDLPFYDAEIEEVVLQPGETRLIKTGIYMEIPDGHVGFLDTRSSSGKAGVDLMCRTIDWDYRGNIRLMVINHDPKPLTIKRGQFLAQIVIMKLNEDRELERVNSPEELSKTDRGDKGFGSTGKGIVQEDDPYKGMPDVCRRILETIDSNPNVNHCIPVKIDELDALEEHIDSISHAIGRKMGGNIKLDLIKDMAWGSAALRVIKEK